MISDKSIKEYFFILDLRKPSCEEENNKVEFIDPENKDKDNDKDNLPKCIQTKEENDKIVKIYKFNSKIIKNNKAEFEFLYDSKKYKIRLNPKDKIFIFDTEVTFQSNNIPVEQTKIDLSEKMNYFYEALSTQKEYEKLNVLYLNSIELYKKKSSFDFLINIFVKVYNTDLCSNLLDIFSKKINEKAIDKISEKAIDTIYKEKIQKYKFDFEQIFDNRADIIKKYSLNSINFYGLIIGYFYICNNEKYGELLDILSKNEFDKKSLFEVMLQYRLFFKKQTCISKALIDNFIQYITTKDFPTFKEGVLFYLKNIDIFLELIDKNKDNIIKMKEFEPLEIPNIQENEEIKFGIINPKIDSVTNFSKDQKKLLIYLKPKFWKDLAKKCSGISREYIEINLVIKELFKNYYSTIKDIFPESDNIRKEIKNCFYIGIFAGQIHRIIEKYIKDNPKITNLEIIELIRDYDEYYTNKTYANIRNPDILEKIDLDEINEQFIQKFKEMHFEKIFEIELDGFLEYLTNKITKISDFGIIFKLIDIKELGDKKSFYLGQLKNKYEKAINSTNELSENDQNLIKNLVDLTTYICINEGNITFLEETIGKSNMINQNIKHKIYIELIKFCKENKNEQIKNFVIKQYTCKLKPDKLREFIDFLVNLNAEDSNNLIEKIDDKYYIAEKDFYSRGINQNIRLLNEILNKHELNLSEDNKYKKNNIKILKKIVEDINKKEISFECLKNFIEDKKDLVMEKLNILALVPDQSVNLDDIYDNLSKYYKKMDDDLVRLSKYKESLDNFHSEIKKDDISKINMNINTIKNETYNKFSKRRGKDIQPLFDLLYNLVKNIDDVKDSKIFKICYEKEMKSNNNKKDNTNPFEKKKKKFTEVKKSLKENSDIIKKDPKNEIIKIIKEQYKENKTIQNELSSLISGKQPNEEELMIMLNVNNFKKDLDAMFAFFKYFKNNEILKIELDELAKKYKNFSNEEDNSKIKRILDELKTKGIYDYKKNIDAKRNYIIFFNLFENEQALAFLDQHTVEDIKPLYEKIVPGADLAINNISDTINCVGFFQELKKNNYGSLKEIIEQLELKLNEENSNIIECFKRYLEVYRGVIELNENFDFSQHIYKEINEIISKSIFIFNKNKDEVNVIKSKGEEVEYKNIELNKIMELKNKIQIKQEEKKRFKF